MDANFTFSHKPGGSPVRNVDNNGKIITDPAKADVSPWSTHCCYMRTVPSKVILYRSSKRAGRGCKLFPVCDTVSVCEVADVSGDGSK